jgi:hypothetical protein
VDGFSINAGWTVTTGFGCFDDVATNDPRIAGAVDNFNGTDHGIFKVDLTSGSAPGSGNYSVDLAFGSHAQGLGNSDHDFYIKDNTTVVIDGTNGGSGFQTAVDHHIDATLSDVSATTTWTGTPASVTFSSTAAFIVLNPDSLATKHTALNHFRLTLQSAGAAVSHPKMLMLLGVGA